MKSNEIKPINERKSDLVKWALSVLLRAKEEDFYGAITFYYDRGKILRAETKKSEKPVLH